MRRILVVDDDEITRTVLMRALSKSGYEVVTVSGVDEGLKILADGDISIVLTDLLMPGKGGIELIYELAQSRPEIKVIAVSAAYEYVNIAEQVGVFRVIRKPFAIKDVLSAIQEAESS